MARIHAGLWVACVTCNPEFKPKREKFVRKEKRTGSMTAEVAVKRQLAAEIGEDEIQSDKKFVLLQKYGVAAPRIDRQVQKPTWMEVKEWRQKQNDWFRATKGLATAKQQPQPRKVVVGLQASPSSRPWKASNQHLKRQGAPSNRPQTTRNFRQN